jgi:hypothetical protein
VPSVKLFLLLPLLLLLLLLIPWTCWPLKALWFWVGSPAS